jgi:hypothetical protein
MDMVAFLREMLEIAKNAESVFKLLEDKKLEMLLTILDTVGDIHFRTAKAAFHDAKKSLSPQREFESAITSLRTAYDAFVTAGSRKGFLGLGEPTNSQRADFFEKATKSALLCAVAYHALGEQNLVQQYATKAQSTFELYGKACVARVNENLPITTSIVGALYIRFNILPGRQEEARDAVERERQLLRQSLKEIGLV